jgi:hypothetical protein
MDADEYRRSYEAEIRSASRGRGGAARRAAKPPPTRQLVATIKDTTKRRAVRLAAIDAASPEAVGKPSVIKALLRVLTDPADDDAVRRAALSALRESSFQAVEFRRYQADYQAALRSAATDDDRALREQAMDVLALHGDEYVQRLLVDGLRSPQAALVEPQRALQMIGYDVHTEHYGLLRDLVETSQQRAVRRTALRLLAADSDAADLFARIAADRSEDPVARSTSAIALASLAPGEFERLAHDVVLDDDEDDAVRATVVNAMAHGPVGADQDVVEKVRTMASSARGSKALGEVAREYVRLTEQEG